MKMKRILLVVALVATCALAYSQPRAVGVRLGYGAAVSYEHQLGQNMISLEVGAPYFTCIEAACTYDWIDPGNTPVPWSKRGEWHWYAGVGASLRTTWSSPGAGFVGVAGRIGIEYDFWFPLQLSLDYRPTIGVAFPYSGGESPVVGYDLYGAGIGLGIRYKF